MMRMESWASVWTTTTNRPWKDNPKRMKRASPAECSPSGMVMDKGSPKAVAASAKVTPCSLSWSRPSQDPSRSKAQFSLEYGLSGISMGYPELSTTSLAIRGGTLPQGPKGLGLKRPFIRTLGRREAVDCASRSETRFPHRTLDRREVATGFVSGPKTAGPACRGANDPTSPTVGCLQFDSPSGPWSPKKKLLPTLKVAQWEGTPANEMSVTHLPQPRRAESGSEGVYLPFLPGLALAHGLGLVPGFLSNSWIFCSSCLGPQLRWRRTEPLRCDREARGGAGR